MLLMFLLNILGVALIAGLRLLEGGIHLDEIKEFAAKIVAVRESRLWY